MCKKEPHKKFKNYILFQYYDSMSREKTISALDGNLTSQEEIFFFFEDLKKKKKERKKKESNVRSLFLYFFGNKIQSIHLF